MAYEDTNIELIRRANSCKGSRRKQGTITHRWGNRLKAHLGYSKCIANVGWARGFLSYLNQRVRDWCKELRHTFAFLADFLYARKLHRSERLHWVRRRNKSAAYQKRIFAIKRFRLHLEQEFTAIGKPVKALWERWGVNLSQELVPDPTLLT